MLNVHRCRLIAHFQTSFPFRTLPPLPQHRLGRLGWILRHHKPVCSIIVTPRDVEMATRDKMQDVTITFGVANATTHRRGFQVGHHRRCCLEPLQARRALVLEAAMTVVAVVKMGFEILTKEPLEAITMIRTWPWLSCRSSTYLHLKYGHSHSPVRAFGCSSIPFISPATEYPDLLGWTEGGA